MPTFRQTAQLAALLLAAVASSGGCGDPGTALVNVTVTAAAPVAGIARLRGTADTGGGAATPIAVELGEGTLPPPRAFGITVSLAGGSHVAIHIEAVDAGGVVLASGDAQTDVLAGVRADVTVVLGAPPSGDGGPPIDGGTHADLGGGPDLTPGGPDLTPAGPDLLAGGDLAPLVCPPGRLHCDGTMSGVCEVDGQTDPLHCGSCAPCPTVANATTTCVAGACKNACKNGFFDCSASGTPCADLLTDGKNCGKCGRDCLGGECKAGVCQAVAIASGQGLPYRVAVRGGKAYWINRYSGSLMSVSLDGTQLTKVASSIGASPNALAVDATSAYWVASGSGAVEKVGQDGTGRTALATGQNDPRGIAVDGAYVYWTNYGSREIHRVTLDGKSSSLLQSGQGPPEEIAVNGTSYYWTIAYAGAGDVRFAPLGGPGSKIITTTKGSGGLALDGSSVYWVSGDEVVKASLAGTGVVHLASGQMPARVAVDAGGVYFTDNKNGGVIMRMGLDGQGLATIASGFVNTYDVALEAKSVVFTTGSAVWRLAR